MADISNSTQLCGNYTSNYNDSVLVYSSESFQNVMAVYREEIHQPLVVGICLFGIVANVLLLVVITRKSMVGPTNILLTGLSFAQLCLLVNFLGQTAYNIVDKRQCSLVTKSYGMVLYLLLNVNLNIVFHTMALVHTTLLAIFRYLAVVYPLRSRSVVSIGGAKKAVLFTYGLVPLLCIPMYFSYTVFGELGQINCTCNKQLYRLRLVQDWLLSFNLWYFGAVGKLVPCVTLTALSIGLIRALREVNERRKTLKGSASSADETNHRRMTIMLLMVVLLFVIVELPMGLLNLLLGVVSSRQFQKEIYTRLGDILEMFTIFYSSVNFVLYCGMSSQFRSEFNSVFFGRRKKRPTDSRFPQLGSDNSTEPHTNGEYLTLLGNSVKDTSVEEEFH